MSNQSTITPELAVEQKRISDPRVSPDGQHIAFVVTPIAQKEEKGTSEIWMVGFDGVEERRFTSGKFCDSAPRWSPDGSRLAFISDREEAGKSQLFVMSAHGGEAIGLTKRKSGVSAPAWSSDGSLLAFLSPDEETEEEEKDKKDRKDAIVVDENLKLNRLYVIDPEGGEPRQISSAGAVNVWHFDWAPDSTRLVAITSPTPNVSDYREPNDMLILNIDGGSRHKLMTHDTGMSAPRWSPDGSTIAVLAREGRIVSQDAIMTVSAENGQGRILTAEYAGAVFDIQWSADGRSLIFLSLENLHGNVGSFSVTSGKARSLLPADMRAHGSFGYELSLDRTGKRFATTRTDSDHPAEVWAGTLGKSLEQVTNRNRALAEAKLARTEVVEWKSSDGMEICGLLVYPLDYQEGRRCPLILQIHGGPAGFWADRFYGSWHDWAQLLAANGYAVLLPNPRGSIGRGAKFTNANFRDLGGMEFQDVMAGVDAMIERGVADRDRLGIGGWSHGGYLTAWAVTQTDRFKAAVMGAGVANMVSDQGQSDIPGFNLDYFYDTLHELYEDVSLLWDRSPMKYITHVKTPTLVLHGEKDERVTAPQGKEFYRGVKAMGVPTQLVVYPREPHGLKEREHQLDLMTRVLGWFRKYVRDA